MTLPTMLFLMQFWSSVYGLNPKIAMAVAETESKFNINATGLAGEVGLFQLKPEYVKDYTRKQLYNPSINIRVGIKRLAEIKNRFGKSKNHGWLTVYNCGESRAKSIKHPELFPYVLEVNKRIARLEKE